MLKNIVKKIKEFNCSDSSQHAQSYSSSPIDLEKLKGMSKHALSLYVRKHDIKNFTKLALSNPEDKSHEDIISKLFSSNDVVDALDINNIAGLSDNKNLLRDLDI